MCRWLAYTGTALLLEEVLYHPTHSLIDQSLNSRLGLTTTNGDGFGVGWYGEGDVPALYKSILPAWHDRNMRELSAQLRSRLVFAHIRASTGTPVQESNCHPFRYGKWLWMHNGAIMGFREIKRELTLAIDPNLYALIEGSTDTERFFFLALTFGLEQDPPAGVARAVGFIEQLGRSHGIECPIRMTVAVSDGQRVWAFRYSTTGQAPTLFYSASPDKLRLLYPENPVFAKLSSETRLVASEPLGDIEGVWTEVPESSYGVIQSGQNDLRPFEPQIPQ